MKTTCLLAALSGLAFAQEPAPVPVRPAPSVPGVPGSRVEVVPRITMSRSSSAALAELEPNWTVPTFEHGELGEPLRWTYGQARASFHDVVRSGPVGFLGVNATPVPHELSAHLTLPADTGLMVEVVAKDSPAEKAGLQANDVLAKLDDQILIDPRQLSVLVANKKEGDSVKISYVRKGETKEANVVIGKRESSGPAMGKVNADVLLERSGGAPLLTFVRRFEIPGGDGGEIKIAGSISEDATVAPAPHDDPAGPPNEDVKKQLEEIRAMLEALQQKVK
ncbi:PDZ domain-containing protein [Luteolibacter arcticus]|uniref:PDZ domain-containing protein n=1 Tax=Luteolibacter arcticus TaxID=1581411 RepID=A0ABT3GE28_9BACT|nr:PDZ domain-containing protein [Luteolibacter arcticus]MCW1921696.1 PDZ domain-containing protein [Luteolibacter arcticus]